MNERYSIEGGVVRDTQTGLVWQREVSPEAYSLEQAQDYADQLTLDGECWRLPTIQELHTLVDYSRHSPAIDVAAFPGPQCAGFWTSSLIADSASYAWVVNFHYGSVDYSNTAYACLVRCVR